MEQGWLTAVGKCSLTRAFAYTEVKRWWHFISRCWERLCSVVHGSFSAEGAAHRQRRKPTVVNESSGFSHWRTSNECGANSCKARACNHRWVVPDCPGSTFFIKKMYGYLKLFAFRKVYGPVSGLVFHLIWFVLWPSSSSITTWIFDSLAKLQNRTQGHF